MNTWTAHSEKHCMPAVPETCQQRWMHVRNRQRRGVKLPPHCIGSDPQDHTCISLARISRRLPEARRMKLSCSPVSGLGRIRRFAPGHSGPRTTSRLISSMLCWVTTSGNVRILAWCNGTQTWSMRTLGSGEMTVRPEKSTRLPDRLPRKRPCLPFSLCTNPRECVLLSCFWYSRLRRASELIYFTHCTCMPKEY